MSELNIQYLPAISLAEYTGNARKHSPAQIRQIARSIEEFGFINPVLIDADGQLLAGHGRLMAARKLGLEKVPAVQIEHLSDAQRRAYMLADNKIAENADWDSSLLKVEIEYLMQADIDFDVDLTGFSTPEIDLILDLDEEATDEDPIPEPPSSESTVTQPGDVWILRHHRVICGDIREEKAISSLFNNEQARMVMTDPPYNVPINGHVVGKGAHQHSEFAMASGEMSEADFSAFLKDSIERMSSHCVSGALLYICMDWRHLDVLQAVCKELSLSSINLCVWAKASGGMGSLYRSQHELILVVKKGKAPHTNNVELGKHGRYRTNVWQYAGMNSFGANRDELLALHPTVKPVAMIADAIKDVTHQGDIVFDGFLGSGTTLLAAEQTHRRCIGVEIDPRYVDVALSRWMSLTGLSPVHRETGSTFEEMREQRLGAECA